MLFSFFFFMELFFLSFGAFINAIFLSFFNSNFLAVYNFLFYDVVIELLREKLS